MSKNFFEEAVKTYSERLPNMLLLERNPGRCLAEKILFEKLTKHKENPRKQATYIAEFLGYKGGSWLVNPNFIRANAFVKRLMEEKVIKIFTKDGIAFSVGYLHVDGTYHCFEIMK